MSRQAAERKDAWDGFLPKGITCKRCGRELRGREEGYPAERYLGTYNGLCYDCTGAPAFRIEDHQDVSGAWYWDHPPSLPSWRRDRTQRFAFEDCYKCRGKGSSWRNCFDAFRSSYLTQCEECSKRRAAHPLVKACYRVTKMRSLRSLLAGLAADRVWKKRLQEAGCPLDIQGGPHDEHGRLVWSPEQERIAKEIKAELDAWGMDWDVDDPPPWPRGLEPTLAERKKVAKTYGYMMDPKDVELALR